MKAWLCDEARMIYKAVRFASFNLATEVWQKLEVPCDAIHVGSDLKFFVRTLTNLHATTKGIQGVHPLGCQIREEVTDKSITSVKIATIAT